jgi:hypothetical protein
MFGELPETRQAAQASSTILNSLPKGRRIVTAAHIQLLQDAVDVVLDCAHLDDQALCDVLVTQAGCD